jgi:hypothetical protein
MLSTMIWRGRLPAAQKPYTLTPKPPNSGLHDPKDRARRSHVARGHALLPRADTCCALVFQNIDRQIPELNPPYNVSLPELDYFRLIIPFIIFYYYFIITPHSDIYNIIRMKNNNIIFVMILLRSQLIRSQGKFIFSLL